MEELDRLIQVLEASANKNGKDAVLTIGHLLNICKKIKRESERDDFESEMQGAYADCF